MHLIMQYLLQTYVRRDNDHSLRAVQLARYRIGIDLHLAIYRTAKLDLGTHRLENVPGLHHTSVQINGTTLEVVIPHLNLVTDLGLGAMFMDGYDHLHVTIV